MHLKYKTLSNCEFGERVAEEEADALSEYFVETENWRNVFSGKLNHYRLTPVGSRLECSSKY